MINMFAALTGERIKRLQILQAMQNVPMGEEVYRGPYYVPKELLELARATFGGNTFEELPAPKPIEKWFHQLP